MEQQETKYETTCETCGSEIDIEESLFYICPYCNSMQGFRVREELNIMEV